MSSNISSLPSIDGTAQSHEESKPDELVLPGTFGQQAGLRILDERIAAADERRKNGDELGARRLLIEGLRAAQEALWDVWDGIPAAHMSLATILHKRENLAEGLRALTPLVLAEQYANDWRVARALLLAAAANQPLEVRLAVLETVLDHLRSILAPEVARGGAPYETAMLPWELPRLSANDVVDKLLVALLDHPNQYMRARAADAIMWLAGKPGAIEIARLFERIANLEVGHGRELAAGILHALAIREPTRLAQMFVKRPEYEAMLCDINFSIAYAAHQILLLSKDTDTPIAATEQPCANTAVLNSDYEWTWRGDINAILDVIEDEGIRKEAQCRLLEVCGGTSPQKAVALLNVRRSAFGCAEDDWSTAWEREAAFRAVARVTAPAITRELAELAMWNPLFPDADLQVEGASLAVQIRHCINEQEWDKCLNIEGKVLLHWEESHLDLELGAKSTTEIVALAVLVTAFTGYVDMEHLFEF